MKKITVFSLFFMIVILGNNCNAKEDFFDASILYEKVQPSLCAILSLDKDGNEISFGSGFVLSKEGLIVTNFHVIYGSSSVNIECGTKKGRVTKVAKYKAGLDLVVLQTNLSELLPLNIFKGKQVKPGSVIFAFGNPYRLQGTITTGLVSGVRTFEGIEYLQVSADINPGNSGGPIVTQSGDLVAIATMGLAGSQGLNFALPSGTIINLPDFNMSISDIPSETSQAKQNKEIVKSSLEFRGLPFGSACDEIKEQGKPVEATNPIFYTSQPNKMTMKILLRDKYNLNYNGKNYIIHNLLGEDVWGVYGCRDGIFTEASYNGIPSNISERLIKSLYIKYGEPKKTKKNELYKDRMSYIQWDILSGQSIKYISEYPSSDSLFYIDDNLKNYLEKKEALKLISNRDL